MWQFYYDFYVLANMYVLSCHQWGKGIERTVICRNILARHSSIFNAHWTQIYLSCYQSFLLHIPIYFFFHFDIAILWFFFTLCLIWGAYFILSDVFAFRYLTFFSYISTILCSIYLLVLFYLFFFAFRHFCVLLFYFFYIYISTVLFCFTSFNFYISTILCCYFILFYYL